jgi:LacI family transcriptional regulator
MPPGRADVLCARQVMKMSINDVAKRAGVSTSTVSRVINAHPRVSADTVMTVRRAMAELGYVPSENRPGPKPHSRTQAAKLSITFITFGSSNRGDTPGFERLIRGVSEAVNQGAMNLSIFHHQDPNRLPERVLETPGHGLLLHGAVPNEEVQARLSHIPSVWLMTNRQRPPWGDQVMPNHYEIGSLAADYLRQRGHQHLAFLNMDSAHWAFQLYYHAFAAAAERNGLSVSRIEQSAAESPDHWFKYDLNTVEAVADQYLALSPRPTGLMVADDMQTALIQPALQRKGMKIGPGKVEIISVNNEQPYLIGLRPWPAAIDIRANIIGARGLSQLQWRIQNPDVPDHIVMLVQPELVHPPAN